VCVSSSIHLFCGSLVASRNCEYIKLKNNNVFGISLYVGVMIFNRNMKAEYNNIFH
jgi:hypothetical protein